MIKELTYIGKNNCQIMHIRNTTEITGMTYLRACTDIACGWKGVMLLSSTYPVCPPE
uniref:Uncharacterized protein n=1 Tax=Setaria italica TaxID=4555 RepID=K3ZBQ3_SETIT